MHIFLIFDQQTGNEKFCSAKKHLSKINQSDTKSSVVQCEKVKSRLRKVAESINTQEMERD